MSRQLGKVDGEGFEARVWLEIAPSAPSGRVWFVGDADIDCDGGSNPHGDRSWQPDTALHYPKKPGGNPIDSEKVCGMVVPGWLVRKVAGVVLGSLGRVTNLRNMKAIDCVVFDTGPTDKVGEITPEAARRLEIDPNPNAGGEDFPALLYEFWPGIPAIVDGIIYELQPT